MKDLCTWINGGDVLEHSALEGKATPNSTVLPYCGKVGRMPGKGVLLDFDSFEQKCSLLAELEGFGRYEE